MSRDGGPAFPTFSAISTCDEGGMTLRDYFAAKAMQGLIENPATCDPEVPLSRRAYEIADAMLAAREGGDS